MFVLELHVSLDIALLFGCVRTERTAEGPNVTALIPLVLVEVASVEVDLVASKTLERLFPPHHTYTWQIRKSTVNKLNRKLQHEQKTNLPSTSVFYILLAFHACNRLERNHLRKPFRLFSIKNIIKKTTHLGSEIFVC